VPSPSERAIQRRIGEVDFLLAGPPCQGWSSLNNHTRGDDPKNRLYERVARVAELIAPRFIVIENVSGVRRGRDRSHERTVERIAKLGYSVVEAVVPLLSIGVAQRRRRHVVVASSTGEFDLAGSLAAFAGGPRTLRWAIGDLAGAETGPFDSAATPSKENARRMRFLQHHKRYNLPNWMRPECHQDDHTYISMYGRLKWNAPAQTITSGYGSMGQGRYVHPNGLRTLTPHEAARLQSFPDWFDFGQGPRGVWASAIGNAVPMKLSYVVAVALLR
jgi:DNA (cytosine-5)-methyltransferase 1